MQNNLRSEDVIWRWGGEEFHFLLPENPLDKAGDVAEKLRLQIEQTPLSLNNTDIPVTMSFGIAIQAPGDRSPVNCINQADSRLYEAKQNGRNQVAPGLVGQTGSLFETEAF